MGFFVAHGVINASAQGLVRTVRRSVPAIWKFKFRFIELLAAKPHPLPLGEVAALKALTERAVSTSYTLSVTACAVTAPP